MSRTVLTYNEAASVKALANTIFYIDEEAVQHFTRDMKDALEARDAIVTYYYYDRELLQASWGRFVYLRLKGSRLWFMNPDVWGRNPVEVDLGNFWTVLNTIDIQTMIFRDRQRGQPINVPVCDEAMTYITSGRDVGEFMGDLRQRFLAGCDYLRGKKWMYVDGKLPKRDEDAMDIDEDLAERVSGITFVHPTKHPSQETAVNHRYAGLPARPLPYNPAQQYPYRPQNRIPSGDTVMEDLSNVPVQPTAQSFAQPYIQPYNQPMNGYHNQASARDYILRKQTRIPSGDTKMADTSHSAEEEGMNGPAQTSYGHTGATWGASSSSHIPVQQANTWIAPVPATAFPANPSGYWGSAPVEVVPEPPVNLYGQLNNAPGPSQGRPRAEDMWNTPVSGPTMHGVAPRRTSYGKGKKRAMDDDNNTDNHPQYGRYTQQAPAAPPAADYIGFDDPIPPVQPIPLANPKIHRPVPGRKIPTKLRPKHHHTSDQPGRGTSITGPSRPHKLGKHFNPYGRPSPKPKMRDNIDLTGLTGISNGNRSRRYSTSDVPPHRLRPTPPRAKGHQSAEPAPIQPVLPDINLSYPTPVTSPVLNHNPKAPPVEPHKLSPPQPSKKKTTTYKPNPNSSGQKRRAEGKTQAQMAAQRLKEEERERRERTTRPEVRHVYQPAPY